MSSDPFSIVALAGDGIGPEVMREAVLVLRAVERLFDLPLRITEAPVGWAAIDSVGRALPDDVHERARLAGVLGTLAARTLDREEALAAYSKV